MITKRYIVFGVIALEVLCIPISAQILDRFVFTDPQLAIATQLPQIEDGVTNLVVSSNTPFTLSVTGATGEIDVKVKGRGFINTTRFGDNAQMPGPATLCARPATTDKSIIYTASQKTAAQEGEILSQSVIFELRYPAGSTPQFEVVPAKQSRKLPLAAACALA